MFQRLMSCRLWCRAASSLSKTSESLPLHITTYTVMSDPPARGRALPPWSGRSEPPGRTEHAWIRPQLAVDPCGSSREQAGCRLCDRPSPCPAMEPECQPCPSGCIRLGRPPCRRGWRCCGLGWTAPSQEADPLRTGLWRTVAVTLALEGQIHGPRPELWELCLS